MLSRKRKHDKRGWEDSDINSPEYKQPCAGDFNMALTNPSPPTESDADHDDAQVVGLKEIHKVLLELKGDVAALLKTSVELKEDVAKLCNSVAKHTKEIQTVREELTKQNRYVASIEKSSGK